MDVDQLATARHDTNVTPNTGGTFGSSSIAIAGPRLRSAAATARQALLGLASERLGVPVAALTVERGVVTGGGRSVTYGELVGDRLLNVAMAAPSIGPGVAPAKPVASYRLVGRARTPRVDVPAKVTGAYTYLQSVRVPGDAARPDRAAARPGRLRPGHRERDRLGRRELDRPHRRRARRAPRRLPRRRRLARVRRDRGGRAAEGRLPRAAARSRAAATSGTRCARSTRPARRRRASSSTPATSTRRSPRRPAR